MQPPLRSRSNHGKYFQVPQNPCSKNHTLNPRVRFFGIPNTKMPRKEHVDTSPSAPRSGPRRAVGGLGQLVSVRRGGDVILMAHTASLPSSSPLFSFFGGVPSSWFPYMVLFPHVCLFCFPYVCFLCESGCFMCFTRYLVSKGSLSAGDRFMGKIQAPIGVNETTHGKWLPSTAGSLSDLFPANPFSYNNYCLGQHDVADQHQLDKGGVCYFGGLHPNERRCASKKPDF